MEDFSLNRENPLPLYHQIKDDMKAKIVNGDLKIGDKLDPELELMKAYGVSRDTMREAMKVLEMDGYIERRRGKGTFIKDTGPKTFDRTEHRYIAVLIPDATIYIFAEILKRVESYTRQEGFDLLFYNTYSNVDNEHTYVKYLTQKKGISGIIIAPALTSRRVNHYSSLKHHRIPLVFIDSMVPYFDTDYVATDNVSGAYKAVDYLLANGCRTVAHIAGPQVATSGCERFEGYKKALADHHIPLDMDIVRFSNFTSHGGYAAANKLLEEIPVDAIFGANCWTTVGALNAISEKGLTVGEDIEVSSFDAIEYSFYSLQTPSVMVAQPCAEIADIAMEILLRRIRERTTPDNYEHITLEPRLIVRGKETMHGSETRFALPVE